MKTSLNDLIKTFIILWWVKRAIWCFAEMKIFLTSPLNTQTVVHMSSKIWSISTCFFNFFVMSWVVITIIKRQSHNSLDNTVLYYHLSWKKNANTATHTHTHARTHRGPGTCHSWLILLPTVKACCSSGLHDTHDVTFLSLLLKYPTTHTFAGLTACI